MRKNIFKILKKLTSTKDIYVAKISIDNDNFNLCVKKKGLIQAKKILDIKYYTLSVNINS